MKFKKTGVFLTSLLLAGNLFAGRFNSPFPRIKKFEDYKKTKPKETYGYIMGKSYFLKVYDTDKDGLFDVVTAHGFKSVDGITTPKEIPTLYCFNFKKDPQSKKQDSKLDFDEIWIDPFEDGWQGDEITYFKFLEMYKEKFRNKR